MNRFERFLRKHSPIAIYRPLRRPAFDVDPKLEQQQEVERRILLADGKNVDKPVRRLIEDQPDYGELEMNRPIG